MRTSPRCRPNSAFLLKSCKKLSNPSSRNPFKVHRLEQFLVAGSATAALDRLASSFYPPSIRLQVLHDFRVTAWCFSPQRQALLTHAFAKSSDPDYRKAVKIHDDRIRRYMEDLQSFFESKRRDRGR